MLRVQSRMFDVQFELSSGGISRVRGEEGADCVSFFEVLVRDLRGRRRRPRIDRIATKRIPFTIESFTSLYIGETFATWEESSSFSSFFSHIVTHEGEKEE